MESIGAEVGQKMRSAIKAKLMELECYVDEELPDYIMVMVANRRTKSQMTEDLNLFLSTKTATFVNWLHIVLKKLKEVTVTNPEVYKKALKRKSEEHLPDDKSILKIKKEKSQKKVKKETESESEIQADREIASMTDDLPISISKLSKNRKIIVSQGRDFLTSDNIVDDNFDIPLLSEVADSANEQELQDIERKIRSVKSRLGLLVESDAEAGDENVKSESAETFAPSINEPETNMVSNSRKITVLEPEVIFESKSVAEQESEHKPKHKRITFENDTEPARSGLDRRARDDSRATTRDRSRERSPYKNSLNKKPSILDRLGKRPESPDRSRSSYRQRETRNTRSRDNRSLSRDRAPGKPGYQRRQESSGHRNRSNSRDRSPIDARSRGLDKDPELIKEGILNRLGVQSKIAVVKKTSLSEPVDEEEEEKVVREVQSAIKVKPRVIPTDTVQPNKNLLLKAVAEAQRSVAQTPKVGKEVEVSKHFQKKRPLETMKKDIMHRLSPKPKVTEIIRKSSSRMRSRLQLSSDDEYDSERESISNAACKIERCKFWPGCRQGDKCEFVHPTESCQLFPKCKFGERCLFLHPKCKFSASCTKRDCPYDHTGSKSVANLKSSVAPPSPICKFFPHCTNLNCQFYHPKPCKYGKFCNNIATCTFSHAVIANRKSLIWTAK